MGHRAGWTYQWVESCDELRQVGNLDLLGDGGAEETTASRHSQHLGQHLQHHIIHSTSNLCCGTALVSMPIRIGSRSPNRTSKLQEKPPALKRENLAHQYMKFRHFLWFSFIGTAFPIRIRIQPTKEQLSWTLEYLGTSIKVVLP